MKKIFWANEAFPPSPCGGPPACLLAYLEPFGPDDEEVHAQEGPLEVPGLVVEGVGLSLLRGRRPSQR